jgi:hypothetical protein
MWLWLGASRPFAAPNALDHDAGFDGSYGAPTAVVDMAAWVFKIVMNPRNMVQCGFYNNVSNYIKRLFHCLVHDNAFVEPATLPCLNMMRAALDLADPVGHPLFRWLLHTVEGFKRRVSEWQDQAEGWKWLKEGKYRPTMAVLIYGHGRIRLQQGGGSLGQRAA